MKTLKKKIKETYNKITSPLYTKIKIQAKKHPKRSGLIMFVIIVLFFAYSLSRVIYMHSDNYVAASKNKKQYGTDTVIKTFGNQVKHMDINLSNIYEIIMIDKEVKEMLKDSTLIQDTTKWIKINNRLDNLTKK